MNKLAGYPSDPAKLGQTLHDVLCTLRTMYVHYQNAHWESKGASFYGDHLMFQRLYEGVAEEVDAVAEKILGLTGEPMFVSALHTLQHGYDTLQVWEHFAGEDGTASRCLFSETYFLEQLDYVRNVLEDTDNMTYGLDDMLGSLASKHEEHVYLLRQRITRTASSEKTMGAGHHFHDNPEKRELRELQHENMPAPTPSEIIDNGGREFSTLSRFVVETAQPTEFPMPSSRDELPKQAKRVRLTRREL